MTHIRSQVNKIFDKKLETKQKHKNSIKNTIFERYDELTPLQQRYYQTPKRVRKHTMLRPAAIEFTKDPIQFMNDHNWSKKAALMPLLSLLIKLDKFFGGNIYMSQEKMAYILGYSYKTINKWIRYLARWGLIQKTHRAMTTCKISVSGFFRSNAARGILGCMLPVLITWGSSTGCCEADKGYTNTCGILTSYNNKTENNNMDTSDDRFLTRDERFRRGCVTGQARNRKQLAELLNNSSKGSLGSPKQVQETLKFKRIPTEKDIPAEHMAKIKSFHLPEHVERKVIDNYLCGLKYKWALEDAGDS